jgi:hypothetical protein
MSVTRSPSVQGVGGDQPTLSSVLEPQTSSPSSSLLNTSQMETQGDINASVSSLPSKQCDESDALVSSYLSQEKGYKIDDTPIPVLQGFFSFKKPLILNSRKTEPSFQTEQLKAHHYPYTDYSPAYNFDNYRIIHVSDQVGKSKKTKVTLNMATVKVVEVNQNFLNTCAYPRPSTTSFGTQVINLSAAEIGSTGAIRAMVPTKNLKDQNTIVSLLVSNYSEPESIFDEVPFVRLMLLLNIMQHPSDVGYTQSCAQQLFTNCVGKVDRTMWLSSPPETDDGTRPEQVSSADGTSNITSWSMRMFASYVSGEASFDNISYDTVFVPVSTQDSGKGWLVPYILAFTTTSWWLGCAGAKVYLRDRETQDSCDNVFLHLVNEACLTSIKGNHERIVLVQIDCWTATANDFRLKVDSEVTRIESGKWTTNFAHIAYKWLGRTSLWNEIPNRSNDLVNALSAMQSHLGIPGLFARCRTLCAELAFSKPRNNFVYTSGPEKPKREIKIEKERNVDGLIARIEQTITDMRVESMNYDHKYLSVAILDALNADQNITKLEPVDREAITNFIVYFIWPNGWEINSPIKTETLADWKNAWDERKTALKNVILTFFGKEVFYEVQEIPHTFWNGFSYIDRTTATAKPSFRYSIGDQQLKDMNLDYPDGNDYKDLEPCLYAQLLCRCSPMQRIPNSLGCSKISTTDEGNFEISTFESHYYQYSLSQATYITRILVASNIWNKLKYLETTRIADTRNEILNQINLSSILSIQAEWLRVFFGYEIFDINGLVNRQNFWPRMLFSLGSVCTYGFIMSDIPNSHILVETLVPNSKAVIKSSFNLLSFFRSHLLADTEFFDLRGGTIPYWLLLNYIMKLAKKSAPFSTTCEVAPSTLDPTSGFEDVFTLRDDSFWYDVPLLTSSTMYDKQQYFKITTQNAKSTILPVYASYGTYSHIDETRKLQYTISKSKSFLPIKNSSTVNVELDCLSFPAMRGPPSSPNICFLISDEANPNARTTRNNANMEKFAPRLTATLMYPDPFFDWLMKVAPGVVENLVSGNPAGALSHVINESAEPVSDWVVNNLPGAVSQFSDWLFRP